jgi:hypothetical protein
MEQWSFDGLIANSFTGAATVVQSKFPVIISVPAGIKRRTPELDITYSTQEL